MLDIGSNNQANGNITELLWIAIASLLIQIFNHEEVSRSYCQNKKKTILCIFFKKQKRLNINFKVQ